MKVQIDLDPRDVWRIQATAERLGITPGQVVRDELARRRQGRELVEGIRERVKAGMCDADIAAELGNAPGYVAEVRRGLGLKANRRYRNGGRCSNDHELDEANRYESPDGRVRCRACARADAQRHRTQSNPNGRKTA